MTFVHLQNSVPPLTDCTTTIFKHQKVSKDMGVGSDTHEKKSGWYGSFPRKILLE